MSDGTLSVSADGIEIERTLDAPRPAVWTALTEPARFARWFGWPNATIAPESVSMAVTPGGAWSATMHIPQTGGEIHWHGRCVEVAEPSRLLFTLSDVEGDAEEPVVFELGDEGADRTHLRFRQSGGHLTEEQYGQAATGWSGFFEALEREAVSAAST
jgi:uncharacterized protein YndB with AHSA1/START domain